MNLRDTLRFLRGLSLGEQGGPFLVRRFAAEGELEAAVDPFGRGLRLAFETLAVGLVLAQLCRQHFDRDIAIEVGVAGAIDLSHAALPQQLVDFVSAQTSACQ